MFFVFFFCFSVCVCFNLISFKDCFSGFSILLVQWCLIFLLFVEMLSDLIMFINILLIISD